MWGARAAWTLTISTIIGVLLITPPVAYPWIESAYFGWFTEVAASLCAIAWASSSWCKPHSPDKGIGVIQRLFVAERWKSLFLPFGQNIIE